MSTAILDMPSTTTTRPQPAPKPQERIVLAGFMGSGKSTIGALLAAKLGWTFLDLDREIERRDGRSVPQIFAESGESAFRKAETKALASLLGQRRVVIALGGGAPEELGNRLLLEQTPRTTVLYLAADFETLLHRCRQQAQQPGAVARPVLEDLALAQARFARRKPHYQRIATHVIQTNDTDAETCLAAVLKTLQPPSNQPKPPSNRLS